MEHSHPDTLDARGAFGREHRPCCALCDAPATVTLGAAEADWIGVRADRVDVCDHCATDIATDLAKLAADDADRAEAALLDAIQHCAREAWVMWGRRAPEPSVAHLVTVHALENRMGLGVDGFVALAVAS